IISPRTVWGQPPSAVGLAKLDGSFCRCYQNRRAALGRQPRAAVATLNPYSPAAFGPLRGLSASAASITGAGPEMPPSFRTRQKWTIISTEATIGIPMQCQMYDRSRALASTIDPPSNPNRTSLYGVMPSTEPNGPSCPSSGVARAIFVPTVTAQN